MQCCKVLWDVDIRRDNHYNRYSLLLESQTIREAGRARCTPTVTPFVEGYLRLAAAIMWSPYKGRLSVAGYPWWMPGEAFVVSAIWLAWLDVLPCSGSAAGEPSAVIGWCRDSLQSYARVVSGVATDERWWCWRSLAEPVATLLLVDLMFTSCERIPEPCWRQSESQCDWQSVNLPVLVSSPIS
jgi:hypothetical protein